MGGSSKSRGDQVTDNSINLAEGGTVLKEGATMTVNETDAGAVEAAFNFGEDALDFGQDSLDLSKTAIEENSRINQVSIEEMRGLSEEAMENVSGMAGDFMDTTDSINNRSVQGVLAATENAMDFSEDALIEVGKNSTAMMGFSDNVLSNLAVANSQNISTVKQLAENLRAGETSETSGQDKTIIYVSVAFVLAVVVIAVARGAK